MDSIIFGSNLFFFSFFKRKNYLRVYGDVVVVDGAGVVKTSVVVVTVVGSVAVDDEEVEHLFLLPW